MMLGLVYVPGVTAVFASAIVPETVIGPPVKPAPVETVVTVPRAIADRVTVPVPAEAEIPGPGTMLVTPVFEIVTLPVGPDNPMPSPATRVFTPPPPPTDEITPNWSTLRPAPTIRGL
jgi:hypothetical protein